MPILILIFKKIGFSILWLFKNPKFLIPAVLVAIVLFQYFTISDKKEEITNLNNRITELESDKATLKTNLATANTKIAEQNASIESRKNAVSELESKFNQAQLDKQKLETQIAEMIEDGGSPTSNSEAMNWLRLKAQEIKTWQDQL